MDIDTRTHLCTCIGTHTLLENLERNAHVQPEAGEQPSG